MGLEARKSPYLSIVRESHKPGIQTLLCELSDHGLQIEDILKDEKTPGKYVINIDGPVENIAAARRDLRSVFDVKNVHPRQERGGRLLCTDAVKVKGYTAIINFRGLYSGFS